jgi:hypothetical protein
MRILGDHTMLYKYLNRNTLFVATCPPGSPGVEPHITVALLDTVSGRMLYRVRHQGAQAPVQVRCRACGLSAWAKLELLRSVYGGFGWQPTRALGCAVSGCNTAQRGW